MRWDEIYLISTLVSDHDKETSMVGFDAICDEGWYSRIQLFPHDVYIYEYGYRCALEVDVYMI